MSQWLILLDFCRIEKSHDSSVIDLRSCCNFVGISSRERIFWRTVRQFAAEYARTRANSSELRRTPANVQCTPANVRRSSAEYRCRRTAGEFARSSREFARIRASSRRTIVRRVYSHFKLRIGLFSFIEK